MNMYATIQDRLNKLSLTDLVLYGEMTSERLENDSYRLEHEEKETLELVEQMIKDECEHRLDRLIEY